MSSPNMRKGDCKYVIWIKIKYICIGIKCQLSELPECHWFPDVRMGGVADGWAAHSSQPTPVCHLSATPCHGW
jgi:hypothetical protein